MIAVGMSQAKDILDRVGPYEIVRPIATGGMAEVYEVRDRVTLEHHALKLLVNEIGRALFDVEYEVMNRLNHPSIVRTHRYGMDGGLPWFSMEFLSATSVGKHVRGAGKPGTLDRYQETWRIGALLARALHHVHERGIVHRDVKSNNVLVLPDGRVKLVDFGVAWLRGVGEPDRDPDTFIGTVGYAPPEQLANEGIDHRADLYALGVLLYRMVTGQRPFASRDPQEVARIQFTKPPPDPRRIVQNVPDMMAELIVALMSRDAGERPTSAGYVADVFDTLAGQTILPGASLALHRPRATVRHAERIEVLTSHSQAIVLVGEDPIERVTVVRDMENDHASHGWKTYVGIVRDVSNRAPLQTALNVSRELPDGCRFFAAFDLTGPVPPMAWKLVGGVVNALRRLEVPVKVVVACDGDVSGCEALADAEIVALPSFGPAETALAVGGLLGRRPPSGALAGRIHKVSCGWPTAINEVVQAIVDEGGVEAEGNQVLWSRYERDVEIPPSVQAIIEAQAEGLNAQQKLILNALALMGDTSMDALRANIPHSGSALENAIEALEARGIVQYCRDQGEVRFRTDVAARALRNRLGSSTRNGLQRMFVKSPELLPLSPFRISTLLQAGRDDEAVRDATELARTWMAEGRHRTAAELLDEVYEANRGRDLDAELAEMLLLFVECSAVTQSKSNQRAVQALGVIKKADIGPELQARSALAAARLQLSIGHYANYQKEIGKALELIRGLGDKPDLAAELQYERGRSELWASNVTAAQRAFGRALEANPQGRFRAAILAGQARCHYERGELRRAEKLANEVIEGASGDRGALGDGLRVYGDTLRRQGRFSEALVRLRRAAVDLRAHPDQRPFLQVQLALGWCEADLNRLGAAQECVDELFGAIRKGEQMHFRLERDLLDAHIGILSGRARQAVYRLQNVVSRGRTAGLRLLANQASVLLLEAQHVARIPHDDIQAFFESRKLQFLADKLIWIWADTCLLYARYHRSRPDPSELMGPVLDRLEGQDVFGIQIEALVAQTAWELAHDNPEAALGASRDAAGIVQMLMLSLEDSEQGAFRVHRWNTLIGESLHEAMRRSGSPLDRR